MYQVNRNSTHDQYSLHRPHTLLEQTHLCYLFITFTYRAGLNAHCEFCWWILCKIIYNYYACPSYSEKLVKAKENKFTITVQYS